MPNFMFAYHGGGKPESPEAGAALMAKWNAWLDGLGDAAIDPGNPVGQSYTVSASGVTNDGGANPLMGFSIIKADTLEAALAIAKTCPHLEMSTGTIEVAEMIEM
ncbi:MAG TPA: YciI family protein [Hyphomicrobiaceae bacterium]|nr:YciI family protein [Hyphomicrobiaceae bacterium]